MKHGVFVLVVLVLVFVMTGGAAVAHAEQVPLPRIRPVDELAAAVLASARARSATVRRLEAIIGRSDVVVYVALGWREPGEAQASLRWVSEAAGLRYLVVKLCHDLPPDLRLEMLAHELHHATEVADATWVNSADEMRQLYQRIGRATSYQGVTFETSGAREVQMQAHRESTASGALQAMAASRR